MSSISFTGVDYLKTPIAKLIGLKVPSKANVLARRFRSLLADLRRIPTEAEFGADNVHAAILIYGSYWILAKECGFRVCRISDEQLINALRTFYAKHNRPPGKRDLGSVNRLPAYSTLMARYGSLAVARRRAGIVKVSHNTWVMKQKPLQPQHLEATN